MDAKTYGLRNRHSDLRELIEHAVRLSWQEKHTKPGPSAMWPSTEAWNAFYQSPPHQVAIHIREVIRKVMRGIDPAPTPVPLTWSNVGDGPPTVQRP